MRIPSCPVGLDAAMAIHTAARGSPLCDAQHGVCAKHQSQLVDCRVAAGQSQLARIKSKKLYIKLMVQDAVFPFFLQNPCFRPCSRMYALMCVTGLDVLTFRKLFGTLLEYCVRYNNVLGETCMRAVNRWWCGGVVLGLQSA